MKKINVLIVNIGGNVGKTTTAAQLLYPRLYDKDGNPPVLVEIETYNKSAADLPGVSSLKKSGSEYKDVYALCFSPQNVIVDVGASNIVEFFKQLQAYQGSVSIFDIIIVPTTQGSKELHDTLKTLVILREYGVPKTKIRVVFNRVSQDVKKEFQLLYDASGVDEYNFNFNSELAVYESEVFKSLGSANETIQNLLADTRDYPALILSSTDNEEKARLIARHMDFMLALTVGQNFDRVFTALDLPFTERQSAQKTGTSQAVAEAEGLSEHKTEAKAKK